MKTPSMIPVSRLEFPEDTDTSARYTIRDIFRAGFPEYVKTHAVPFYKERAISAMMACGTGELGYTLGTCSECGTIIMHADSCGNRNCPSCGYPKQVRWAMERNEDLLEGVPYVHVVFTLPHELNPLVYANQKVLLNHLFSTVKKSVLDLCMEEYKLVPGLLMVLHTFSSSLTLHYHIHMLATAAGLTPDHSSFRNFGAGGYFLPVQQLSKRYRSLFLEGIRQLNESEQLTFSGDAAALRNSYAWSELLNACYEKEWNVEIKKYQVHRAESGTAGSGLTADTFGRYVLHRPVSPEKVHHTNLSPASPVPSEDPQSEDPEADVVTEYFSQYAFRTAITDNRISSWNQRAVIFEYKRYHDGKCNRELMTVETGEFIRRFLLHILESGFQRIRYAGFLASCIRKKMLSIIRGILNLKGPNASNASCKKLTLAELVEQLTGINPSACPVCKGKINNIVHRIKIRELSSKGITNCYLRGS